MSFACNKAFHEQWQNEKRVHWTSKTLQQMISMLLKEGINPPTRWKWSMFLRNSKMKINYFVFFISSLNFFYTQLKDMLLCLKKKNSLRLYVCMHFVWVCCVHFYDMLEREKEKIKYSRPIIFGHFFFHLLKSN